MIELRQLRNLPQRLVPLLVLALAVLSSTAFAIPKQTSDLLVFVVPQIEVATTQRVVLRLDLDIISRQNTGNETYTADSASASAQLNFGISSGSGSFSQTNINNNAASVGAGQQSGLVASNNLTVNVAGNTDLDGGILSAPAGTLNTGSLAAKTIANSYQSGGSTFGLGVSATGGALLNGAFNLALNGLSVVGNGASGAGETLAAVSGNITIDAASGTPAGLNRNAATANGPVSDPFNLQKTETELQIAQLAGQVGMTGAGILADKIEAQAQAQANGNSAVAEAFSENADGYGRIALHALVAAGGSNLAGGNIGTGVAAALGTVAGDEAVAQAAPYIAQAVADSGLPPAAEVAANGLLQTVVAAGAGSAVGGALGGTNGAYAGANGATAADLFNRQLTPLEIGFIQNHASAFADNEGLTTAQAEKLLAEEGYVLVQAGAAAPTGYTAAQVSDAQSFLLTYTPLFNGYFTVDSFAAFVDPTLGQSPLTSAFDAQYGLIAPTPAQIEASLPSQTVQNTVDLVNQLLPLVLAGIVPAAALDEAETVDETITAAPNTGTASEPAGLPAPQTHTVPDGYAVTTNADGTYTVTGPQGGAYQSTGLYDSNTGYPIFQTSNGSYVTLEGSNTPVPSPYTSNGSPLSQVQINQQAHTDTLNDVAQVIPAQTPGVTVNPAQSVTYIGSNGVTTTSVPDQVLTGGTPNGTVPVPAGYTATDINGNPLTSIPLSSEGQAVLEMKTGNGQLTPQQQIVYPQIAAGNVIVPSLASVPTPVVILRPTP